MINKLIYIPGFGNLEDDIFKNKFNNIKDKYLLQYNLRGIDYKKVKRFLENKENIEKIMKKYDLSKLKESKIPLKFFKGFTRTIKLTTELTAREIINIIKNNEGNYILAGHSQGGLILIETILKNPSLLDKIKKIELLAPVINYEVGYNFHKGINKSYFLPYGKNVIVRKKYIKELETGGNKNKLEDFLKLLKQKNWNGELELILGKNDKVIPQKLFDINKIKKIYPNINIKVIDNADHYLGFKK